MVEKTIREHKFLTSFCPLGIMTKTVCIYLNANQTMIKYHLLIVAFIF